MRINSRRPLALRMPLNSHFFPRTSREWNQLPAEVVVSPSLAVFKEKATLSFQTSQGINM